MSTTHETIVYVDDDRGNRLAFTHCFEDRYDVRAVASGAEALELMRCHEVAVLITDQRMPLLSGHELLMRAKRGHPHTIRMVVTAYSDLDPILRAVNEGLVARYVLKPWDREELGQMLAWAVGAHRLGLEDSALQVRLLRTERLATLGSISSALVHDLCQPLVGLAHNVERLGQIAAALHGAADAARPEIVELATELDEIADEATKTCALMLQMTDSIRQFGRPPNPAERPECEPRQVIRQVLGLVRDEALRREVRLVYDGPEALPSVRIASVELVQIVLNLLTNATQAIAAGRRPGQVVLAVGATASHVELTIRDDGVGMGAEAIRRAGTPFFTTRPDGSGLGLAQCFRLAGRAGGTLSIRSAEERGTSVELRLPRADQPTVA